MRELTIADFTHHASDPECPACVGDYPETCGCGGLIHATTGTDEDDDGNPVLATECDECGRSEDELTDD